MPWLTFSPLVKAEPERAAAMAIEMAQRFGCEIGFTYEGVGIEVGPADTVAEVVERWRKAKG